MLDPIGNKTVDEEESFNFTVSGSDPDVPVQPLTYSATGLPEDRVGRRTAARGFVLDAAVHKTLDRRPLLTLL